MDIWREDGTRTQNHNQNPSFSSTLLDAIYRSIDDQSNGKRVDEKELRYFKETTRKNCTKDQERSLKIEEWMTMEKKKKKVSAEKVVITRRKSMADFERNSVLLMNSSSSSSDSSCGSGFSSSETDSFYGGKSTARSRSSSCYSMQLQRPKPIRTERSSSLSSQINQTHNPHHHHHQHHQKPKNYESAKSKALKIYSELKKVKQPISPGGRLASFLNSLFTNGNSKNGKKAKVSSPSMSNDYRHHYQQKPEPELNCSSASSFSRSCLSKTPSSRGSTTTTKRSVRFYPVSVIVDEDCRPCGHKNLYNEKTSHPIPTKEELLKSYQKNIIIKKKEAEFDDQDHHMRDVINISDDEEEEDEDDDAASYASSDLFELDNLANIGIDHQRYHQELPVYETTHLVTNRAIANGFI